MSRYNYIMGKISDFKMSVWIRHFFHVVSNVKPLVWISGYLLLIPIFAFIYWLLPESQFRIPDGASTDFGSWVYYSIVTITTLGFGDYTPARSGAQCVTSLEVMCGLMLLGFFLNAVGAMKSEVDLTTERERQRAMHASHQHDRLVKMIPLIVHRVNSFLAYCYAVTTPIAARGNVHEFKENFTLADMADMYKPSGFADDISGLPAVDVLMRQAGKLSLCLDSMQTRIDLTLWPELQEECFTFVANYQLLDAIVNLTQPVDSKVIESTTHIPQQPAVGVLRPVVEVYHFVKENGELAHKIEMLLTKISGEDPLAQQ